MAKESLIEGGVGPLVECSVCLKEIPESAVFTPEGMEYVGHFCGLDCYEEFLRLRRKAAQEKGQHGA